MYTHMQVTPDTHREHKTQTLSAFPAIYYAALGLTAQVLDMAVILLKS